MTDQGPGSARVEPTVQRVRRFLGTALSLLAVVLWLVFGRQGGGPDWLLGVWLGLVVAMSVVTATARRTRRERMV